MKSGTIPFRWFNLFPINNNFSFLRKGVVGDSQTTSLLSKHQRDEFQELLQSQRFEEKLKLIIEDQEVVEKIKAIAYAR